MNYLIPFLILITVVVFIHEYGHYYFAKKYGVGITDFSIGFGSEIFGWNDKSGTRWKICWIPLGGYVKFFGDRNVFSQSEQQELINHPKAKVLVLIPFGFFSQLIKIKALYVLGFWFILQFISSGGGVAYAAHIGGFVTGIILILFFNKKRKKKFKIIKGPWS